MNTLKFDTFIDLHGKKIAVLLMMLFLLTYLSHAYPWDINLLEQINLKRNRSLDSWFRLVTDYVAAIAYTTPLFLWGLAVIKQHANDKLKAEYIIQSTLLAAVTSTVIKHIVNRPRPFITYPIIEKVTTGGGPSFPSGHTSDAFTLAITLSIAYPKWYVIIPSVLWAITVGYTRMDLGVHYPSDVMGSIFLAMFSALVSYILARRRKKNAVLSEDI